MSYQIKQEAEYCTKCDTDGLPPFRSDEQTIRRCSCCGTEYARQEADSPYELFPCGCALLNNERIAICSAHNTQLRNLQSRRYVAKLSTSDKGNRQTQFFAPTEQACEEWALGKWEDGKQVLGGALNDKLDTVVIYEIVETKVKEICIG